MQKKQYELLNEKLRCYIAENSNIIFEAVINENSDLESKYIKCVDDYCSFEEYDVVLVWNKKNLQDDILQKMNNVFCIDESFFQLIDVKILLWLNYKYQTIDDAQRFDLVSRENFLRLKQKKYKKSYVFGTGPSMKEGMDIYLKYEQKKDGLCKIVCNTAINNIDYLNRICPDIYVISDSIFLSNEYEEVIKKIINYVNKHEMVLCIPCFWLPICLQKYSLDSAKVVGFHEMKDEMSIPIQEDLELYSKAHNVITKYAIPIASTLTEEVYISGCDGASILDNGDLVYNHADDVLAINKKNEVLNHYSFFRQVIEYGESKGKKYYSITKSYIPILQEKSISIRTNDNFHMI